MDGDDLDGAGLGDDEEDDEGESRIGYMFVIGEDGGASRAEAASLGALFQVVAKAPCMGSLHITLEPRASDGAVLLLEIRRAPDADDETWRALHQAIRARGYPVEAVDSPEEDGPPRPEDDVLEVVLCGDPFAERLPSLVSRVL